MRKFAWSLLAITLFAPAAMAATLTSQVQGYSGVPGFNKTLTFNKFDTTGGRVLYSVRIDVDLHASGGALKLDNDGGSVASGSVDFGADVSLSSTSVKLLDTGSNQIGMVTATGSGAMSLAADDGDAEAGGTAFFSYVGSDYGAYNGGTVSDATAGYVASTWWSGYTAAGAGTFTIKVTANQVNDYSALGGCQAQIDPLNVLGTVIVTYEYIPEPASLSVLALGGLAVLGRKRR